MVQTKSYLKYAAAGKCNIVASADANLSLNNDNASCFAAAVEDVCQYNKKTGELVNTFPGDHQVTALSSCPFQNFLAVGYRDGSIKLFDISDAGNPKVVYCGHKAGITCFCWYEERILISGSKDSTLIAWDLITECGIYRLLGHKNAVTQCRIIPQRKILLSSSKDSLVKFWDLTTQHCFFTIAAIKGDVWDFALIKNYSQLIIGSIELELQVFNIKHTGNENSDSNENTAAEIIKRVRVDEKENPADFDDASLKFCDGGIVSFDCTKTGSIVRTVKQRVCQLVCSADERLLFVLANSNVMEILRLFTEDEIKHRLQKKVKRRRKAANFSSSVAVEEILDVDQPADFELQFRRLGEFRFDAKPKNAVVTILTESSIYEILVLLSNNLIERYSGKFEHGKEFSIEKIGRIGGQGHRSEIRSLAFSNDSTAFLSGSSDEIKIWNRSSLSCIRTMKTGEQIVSSTFVAGDRYCIVGTKAGSIMMFDIASAELLQNVGAHEGAVWEICRSPDNRRIVSVGSDKMLKVWNFELITEGERKQLSLVLSNSFKFGDEILCMRYSPDGKFIACGLLDNTVKIHFADSFKFFLSLYGHSLPVLCLDISTDCKLIVTGSADKNVKIWGLDFGDCHRSLLAHDDSVTCVRFVPKSHLFFSAGKDGKVKQWDGEKFEKILTLEGHYMEIWAMAISGNGNHLITGSHDRSIRLWEKTAELLVLQEEQEIEREKGNEEAMLEEQIVPVVGEKSGEEVELVTKKSLDTIKSAELLITALEICRTEKEAEAETETETSGEKRQRHPLLIAMKSSSLDSFLVDILRKINSAELEKSLLLLSFAESLELLTLLANALEKNSSEVELLCRLILFLVRLHHKELVSSTAKPLLDRLNCLVLPKLNQLRDQVGSNMAAMHLIYNRLASADDVQLFADVSQKQNKKRRKLKTQQETPIISL